MLIDESSLKYYENNIMPIPESGCLIWMGTITMWGYGKIAYNGYYLFAHRWAWQLFNGEIPKGLCVCHKCDVRCCVNPNHLFLGTYADNLHDMAIKGRSARGEKNARAKLTQKQVDEIRDAKQIEGKELAKRYGVSKALISYILNNKLWKKDKYLVI